LSWLPQPEFGGFYAAVLQGLDKKNGIALHLQPGGPSIAPPTFVASGKAQFGIAEADQILQARQQGVPLVAVASYTQRYPQCLMYHVSSGIKNVSDISGHTVAVQGFLSYWPWVKYKYHLTNIKEVPYNGTDTQFQLDKSLVQQCYATREPYFVKIGKITDAGFLQLPDLGFNPYQVVFTTESEIAKHPDVVAAIVKTVREGWASYIANPAAANADILKRQPALGAPNVQYVGSVMKNFVGSPVGNMTSSRWRQLYQQLVAINSVKSGLDWKAAFTTQFLK
jgi:NitT/TauT family transport system substrate-binding protein